MASAWSRSSLSLRNARSVNSPASAGRAPRVDAAAVAVELDDVLARERARTFEEQHQAAIERLAVGVDERARRGLARPRI